MTKQKLGGERNDVKQMPSTIIGACICEINIVSHDTYYIEKEPRSRE